MTGSTKINRKENLPRVAFPCIDIVEKTFSELQIWLERRETHSTQKLWPIRPSCFCNNYPLDAVMSAVPCGLHVRGEASTDSLVPEDKPGIALLVY